MESSRLPRRERLPEPLGARLVDRLGLRQLDGWLLLAALGLVLVSVLTLDAASEKPIAGAPDLLSQRQAVYGLIGIVGMLLLARFDYSRFRDLRTGLYALLCISIIATFVFGFAARGSTQSIELPLFTFQPAEPVRPSLSCSFFMGAAARGSMSPTRERIRCQCFERLLIGKASLWCTPGACLRVMAVRPGQIAARITKLPVMSMTSGFSMR